MIDESLRSDIITASLLPAAKKIDMDQVFAALKKIFFFDSQKQFYSQHFPDVSQEEGMQFRPMRKSDLKAVVTIEEQSYPFPWSLGIFKNCLKVGYSCWVGEAEGEVVAYGILSIGVGEAHVMNVCVSPRCQGQGYGREMMLHLMEVARNHRADMMLLEVRPSNKVAVHLYRKLGFNEIGTRKGYYPAGANKREDALVLARML